MNLSSEYIIVVVQQTQFKLSRDLIVSQTDNIQIQSNSNISLPLPEWVTKDIYLLIQKYLKTKNIKVLVDYIHDNNIVIKLLRTSDYLGLTKFHEEFITKLIIPNINESNCIILLQQTQKRLKNLDNNAQCWLALLNASIHYLSSHLYELFSKDPTRLRKMNQKILNEVLDRAIRLEKKNHYEGKHLLFKLIMESKNMDRITLLCWNQRAAIQQKKINAKIHAKLSWKLQNVKTHNQKRTKDFKFLDLDWYLQAIRDSIPDSLIVSLNLINKNIDNDDNFTKIGVFYTKLIQNVEGKVIESDISIHYLPLDQSSNVKVLTLDPQRQQQLGSKKLELNIYCSLELVYTFIINYVLHNYDRLKINGKELSKDELVILIETSKKIKKYTQALYLTNDLFSLPGYNPQSNKHILENYPEHQLSTFEQGLIKQLKQIAGIKDINKNQVIRNQSQNMGRIINPLYKIQYDNYAANSRPNGIDLQRNSSQLIRANISGNIRQQPQQHLNFHNNTSIKLDQKSVDIKGRGDSRIRGRKIFDLSPNKKNQKNSKKDQMLKITDLRNYLHNPNSHIGKYLNSIAMQ